MILDGQVISTLLIGVTGLLVWANTQTQARSKSQRAELRHRRALGIEQERRTFDLEQALAMHGIDLPAKRVELTAAMEEDW